MQNADSSTKAHLIAEHLDSQRDHIVADWMDAVQNDPAIPSADRLTMEALEDHFPEMLMELITAIGRRGDATNQPEVREAGREHGESRWRDGYRLDELVRELGRVRQIIVTRVSIFSQARVTDTVRDLSIRVVHRVFDSFLGASAQQFVDAQQSELVLRSNQMVRANEILHAATGLRRPAAESRLGLLRAVNHELRNAIQPVTIAADLLMNESEPALRFDISSHLSVVAARLQSLLDRLQKLSTLLSGEIRLRVATINLTDVLANLAQTHRGAAERKGLRFEKQLSMKMPQVDSDREQLEHIGEQLITNAIQFTDTGHVRLSMIDAKPDRWILRVSDTGSGIEPTQAAHLFHELHSPIPEPSAHPRLGLVIARHVANLLQGDISFKTEPGSGSTFDVNLPRAA